MLPWGHGTPSLHRPSSNMRLLAVCDLHYHLPWFSWTVRESARFDAVIFAGDFVDIFAPDLGRQAAYVRQWLSEFPRPIFCATGNHDVEVAEDFIAAAAIANPRVHPDGTDMQIEEMRVVCVPWGAPLHTRLSSLHTRLRRRRRSLGQKQAIVGPMTFLR